MKEETCKNCGRVYKFKQHKSPMRDKDSIDCKCGKEIIKWNGGVWFTVDSIQNEPNQENNS